MDSNTPERHPGPACAGQSTIVVPSLINPVTLQDRELFESAFANLQYPISDATFAATLAWSQALRFGWTVLDRHLCLFSAADGDLSMMLPPTPLSPDDDRYLAEALESCFELMDSVNGSGPGLERSRIEYVSDERLDAIRAINTISLSASPMHADYIYQREALAELAGGPLKGKRKLRSKFLRENSDVTTGDITPDDVPDCIALLDRWCRHGDERHEGAANDRLVGVDLLRQRDRSSTLVYLNTIDDLGLPSMTVRVGGRLVGFTIGERMTPSMATVAVEKTDPDFPGAPQFIYSEFCATRLAGCAEINAGDDWGIATLRASKESYRPSRMLPKSELTRGAVVATGAPETTTVQLLLSRPAVSTATRTVALGIRVRQAVQADATAMFAVENAAFNEPDDRFNQRQIRRLILNPRARVAVAEQDGVIVGWSAALIRQHVRWQSGRVYSVAVHPDAAGKGIGRSLLNWSLASLTDAGISRVYLEVRETNTAAIRLYHDTGFVTIGRLASYYGRGVDGLRLRRVGSPTTPAAAAKPANG